MELIIQLISGAVGGNAAGGLLKNLSLGTVGNTLTGLLGGFAGGNILGLIPGVGDLLGSLGATGGSVASAGAGGLVVTALIGFVKKIIMK